jgi:hypothetical protein
MRDSSAYSNHNVVAPCFALYYTHCHTYSIDRYPTCSNLATRIGLPLLATEVYDPSLVLCCLPEPLIAAAVFDLLFVGTPALRTTLLLPRRALADGASSFRPQASLLEAYS